MGTKKSVRIPDSQAEAMLDVQPPEPRIVLEPPALSHLASIRKWTLFLSILGFIAAGLMVFFGFGLAIMMGMIDEFGEAGTFLAAFVIIFYAGIGIGYFFPAYFLFRFSDRLKRAITWNDTEAMTSALGYLKSHYVFLGVAVIALIGLYILIIIGVVIFGIVAGSAAGVFYT